ncbi:arginine decarboxylase, pyruvoyl-dependent [Patescibacteria group bacterium]|nr:arginine decarboxylase, pyruvoyl-dependent [Patescibacteria group bacterium]
MFPVPDNVFFTKGVGVHTEKLQSFELALRHADIEQQNLVMVSSIFPPHCKIITRKEGLNRLRAGAINFCVMARAETSEPGRVISASVGLARPVDKNRYGYLSEHHGYGMNSRNSSEYAEDLAATMLATTLGIPFNSDDAWNERKQVYQTSKLIIDSRSVTASIKGDPKGRWTCAIAAAVFLFKD